jgi:hypothetical protein
MERKGQSDEQQQNFQAPKKRSKNTVVTDQFVHRVIDAIGNMPPGTFFGMRNPNKSRPNGESTTQEKTRTTY